MHFGVLNYILSFWLLSTIKLGCLWSNIILLIVINLKLTKKISELLVSQRKKYILSNLTLQPNIFYSGCHYFCTHAHCRSFSYRPLTQIYMDHPKYRQVKIYIVFFDIFFSLHFATVIIIDNSKVK